MVYQSRSLGPAVPSLAAQVAAGSFWQDVKIGGGGYARSSAMHSDGSQLANVDVYGVYLGNTTVGMTWKQIVTSTSTPSSISPTGLGQLPGYDATFAPSNSSVIYAALQGSYLTNDVTANAIVVSQNKGALFTLAGLNGLFFQGNNAAPGAPGVSAQFLAVDPANPSICYFGAPHCGPFVTVNGLSGTPTWAVVPITALNITTSSTSKTISGALIGTSQNFTVGAGLTFSITPGSGTTGPQAVVYDSSNAQNYIILRLDSYSGTTLTGTVTGIGGSGAISAWTVRQNVNSNGNAGCNAICFDPTSGTTGGATNKIVIGIEGSGVYRSIDAGGSFSLVSGSSTKPGHAKCGADGTFYGVARDSSTVWRITPTGTYTNDISDGAGQYITIVCDPNDPTRAALDKFGLKLNMNLTAVNTGTPTWSFFTFGGNLTAAAGQPTWMQGSDGSLGSLSLSDGELWWDPLSSTSATSNTVGTGTKNFTIGTNLNVVAGDTLRFTQNGTPANFMRGPVNSYNPSTGAVQINATSSGGSGTINNWNVGKERIWCSNGIGAFYTDSTEAGVATDWKVATAGMESMVCNQIVWPSGRNPLAAFWDRPLWNLSNPNTYQPGYGPNYANEIVFGASIAFAMTDSSFVVGLTNGSSGYSTNNGLWNTWTLFTTQPPGPGGANGGGGTIVAVDTNKFVVARSNNGAIYQTQNRGGAWSAVTGAPTSGWGDLAFNGNPVSLAVDYVNGNVYGYNKGGSAGVYVSTDGGISMSAVFSGHIDASDFGNIQLKAVPGNANHLLWCCQTTSCGFYQSTNGGASWTAAPNVRDVRAFGTGAAKPGGGGYPAVYIAGFVSGVYGIWRSDDFHLGIASATWNQMTVYPQRIDLDPTGGGWTDFVVAIAGNPDRWNSVIVGFNGTSCAYYGPSGTY